MSRVLGAAALRLPVVFLALTVFLLGFPQEAEQEVGCCYTTQGDAKQQSSAGKIGVQVFFGVVGLQGFWGFRF